jgi:hypothetical protein
MPFAWNGGAEGVTLTVEAGLSAATGTYLLFDVGQFDVGTFGPDAVWSDVSAYVRALTSTRKFGREVQAWDVGTASFVLDNTKRYFSPSNLSASSPYVTGGISQIRPLRPMRWSATYQGVTYYGYTGYSTAWEETFLPGMVDAYVTVPCEDEMSMIAAFDGLELIAGRGGGAVWASDPPDPRQRPQHSHPRDRDRPGHHAGHHARPERGHRDQTGRRLRGWGVLRRRRRDAGLRGPVRAAGERPQQHRPGHVLRRRRTATCRAGTSRSTTAATW